MRQIIFMLVTLMFTNPSFAEVIGHITNIEGSAYILTKNEKSPLTAGANVHQGAEIFTNKGAKLKITFVDESEIYLSEETHLILDKYIYNPKEEKGESYLTAAKGMFKFVTGKIANWNPKNYQLSTQSSTIGVRGSAGFIKVNEEGTTTVCVIECCLDLSNGKETVSLNQKQDFAKIEGKTKKVAETGRITDQMYNDWEKMVSFE